MSVDKNAPESIHLCDFPTVHEEWIDKDLEQNMEEVLHMVVMGRAARNAANIKNRQPIGTMFVKAEKELPAFFKEIVEEELNVKEVVFREDMSSLTSYSFKPQLRTVGPKYGKVLAGIKEYLAAIDGLAAAAAVTNLKDGGTLDFEVNGTAVSLREEDLLIEVAQMEGYVTEADNNMTVVLDTNLTESLIEEGFVYEVISKIQTMRKEADFEVLDHIKVSICDNVKLSAIVEKNQAVIAGKVLADSISSDETLAISKEWNVNGEKVTIGVEKC